MKESKIESLLEKYKEGKTTLKEEQFLFDNSKNSEPFLEGWSTFVKNNKILIPKDLNDTLWESFQTKKSKKQKMHFVIMSAAASALLLISLFSTNLDQKKLNYSEKETLLNQAIDMMTNDGQPQILKSIFYEDEMIIVYATVE